MLVNNEVGTVQPLAEAVAVVRSPRADALVHTDAVAAVGWCDVAAETAAADLVSVSAHKFGGPKGVGALDRAPRRPALAGAPRRFAGARSASGHGRRTRRRRHGRGVARRHRTPRRHGAHRGAPARSSGGGAFGGDPRAASHRRQRRHRRIPARDRRPRRRPDGPLQLPRLHRRCRSGGAPAASRRRRCVCLGGSGLRQRCAGPEPRAARHGARPRPGALRRCACRSATRPPTPRSTTSWRSCPRSSNGCGADRARPGSDVRRCGLVGGGRPLGRRRA